MIAAKSSGLILELATNDGGASIMLTESAWGPRRPSATPNSSRVPGLTLVTPAGSEVAGRKTSSPSSDAMKPKPFSRLNHLTRPVGIIISINSSGVAGK